MSSVLVVEDEQHLADGLRFNLEAEGYTVDTVSDGEAALSLLLEGSDRHYDAVVLDVMLPGKDGFTVAAELRASGQFVPVLMLTARGRPEDVLRGFESGSRRLLSQSHLSSRFHGPLERVAAPARMVSKGPVGPSTGRGARSPLQRHRSEDVF